MTHNAQERPAKPWTNGDFRGFPKGNYEWKVVSGKDRKAAYSDFQAFLSTKFGCTGSAEITETLFVDHANPNKEQRDVLSIRTVTKCQGGTVWYVKADEETRGCLTYQLYQYSTIGDFKAYCPHYEWVNDYDQSKATVMSFVPFGVPQFYKGNKGAGTFFLITQAAAVGTAGFTWILSNSYYNKYYNERHPSKRTEYEELWKDTQNICYISLGITGVLYLGGMFHGLFAEGKHKKWELAIAPYIAPNNKDLALSFNFKQKF